MKLFDKWKEHWLRQNEDKLKTELEPRLNEIRSQFENTLKAEKERFDSIYADCKKQYEGLIFKQTEIDELSKRLDERKIALSRENEELKTQLRIIEAKASPSSVWTEAFTAGFNKAWDMMFLQQEGMEKVKKLIEDNAINETLSRMKLNGNYKKNN